MKNNRGVVFGASSAGALGFLYQISMPLRLNALGELAIYPTDVKVFVFVCLSLHKQAGYARSD